MRFDPSRHRPLDGARQADAEDCVHDDVGARQTPLAPGADLAARLRELLESTVGVAFQTGRIEDRCDRDVETRLSGHSREHVAVSTVVPRPADDHDASRPRPRLLQHRARRRPGARHERVRGNAEHGGGATVQLADLRDAVHCKRQGVHGVEA